MASEETLQMAQLVTNVVSDDATSMFEIAREKTSQRKIQTRSKKNDKTSESGPNIIKTKGIRRKKSALQMHSIMIICVPMLLSCYYSMAVVLQITTTTTATETTTNTLIVSQSNQKHELMLNANGKQSPMDLAPLSAANEALQDKQQQHHLDSQKQLQQQREHHLDLQNPLIWASQKRPGKSPM